VWVIIDIMSPREQWLALGDGFRVDVKIAVREMEHAIVVPIGALFRRGDDWYTFVVEDGHGRLRKVQLGLRSGRLASIARGLIAGDIVVKFPPSSLSDGSRVKVQ
jgi:HlyD family secretion protein